MLSWRQCRQPCRLPNLIDLFGCTVRLVWVRPGLLISSEAACKKNPLEQSSQPARGKGFWEVLPLPRRDNLEIHESYHLAG